MSALFHCEITPRQCRMARVVLELGVREIGALADVSPNTIARFERGEVLLPRTIRAIQSAFEGFDLIFEIDSDGYEFVGFRP